MTPDQIEKIQETIRETIEVKVNGRIEALHLKVDTHNEKHEAAMDTFNVHMKKMEPILEAYTGAGALGSLLKWLSGVVVSIGILWLALKGFFPIK